MPTFRVWLNHMKGGCANLLFEREITRQSLFTWSPWMTTLLSALDRQLILILINLMVEHHILDCMANYIKERISSVKLLALN